jgi:hypothetical protein
MGMYRELSPLNLICPKCHNNFVDAAQFKSGVDRGGGKHTVGEHVDLADGLYIGIYKVFCTKCAGLNENKQEYKCININVNQGIIKYGEKIDELENVMGKKYFPATSLLNCFDQNKAVDEDTFTYTYSPFSFLSLESLKRLILYSDKVVINYTLSDKIDDTRFVDNFTFNPNVFSYIQNKMAHEIPDKIKKWLSQQPDDIAELPILLARDFLYKVYKDFSQQTSLLLNEGIIEYHYPTDKMQQLFVEYLRRYYIDDPFSPSGQALHSIFFRESPNACYITEDAGVYNCLANCITRLQQDKFFKEDKYTTWRNLRNNLALKTIEYALPDLQFRTFDDILETRIQLKDELIGFRQEINSLTNKIRNQLAIEDIEGGGAEQLFSKHVRPKIDDLSKKISTANSTLIKKAYTGAGKGSIAFLCSIAGGASLGLSALLAGGVFGIDLLSDLDDYLKNRKGINIDNGLSFLMKAKSRL